MKTVSVGEFKAQFSDLLDRVRAGERILIQYGRRKVVVAMLAPIAANKTVRKRPLGVLRGKASFKLRADFKMNEEDFLKG